MQPDNQSKLAAGIDMVRHKHYSIGHAARAVGVSYDMLWRALNPEKAALRNARRRETQRLTELGLRKPDNRWRHIPGYSPPVPDDILAERDRVLSQPRSITAMLMGDPPVGRSALDRR